MNETSTQMPDDMGSAPAEPVAGARKPRRTATKTDTGVEVAAKRKPRTAAKAKAVEESAGNVAQAVAAGEKPAAPRKRAAAKPRSKAAEAVVVGVQVDAVPEAAVVQAAEPEAAVAGLAPVEAALAAAEEREPGVRGAVAGRSGEKGARADHQQAAMGYAFADVVSGELDAELELEQAQAQPTKRVLLPQADSPKLHKVLAQAGMGSRLEMEQLILEGRISVNNEPAHIGQRIQYGDQIKVNGKPIRYRIDPPPARVIAYHKPAGEVVTHDDPQNRPTVFRKLPKLQHGKWQSVGRLDLNTEGLLLFTSSGELANSLMHPRFGLEREYAARVLGALSKEERQSLIDGVQLEDGEAAFGSIEEGGGEGANCWYRVTISEGRNREVRRMFEAVGHAVSRLIRIRYGAMVLPRGLRRGAWLELDQADIQALMSAAGVKPRPAGDRNTGNSRGNGQRDQGRGRQRDGQRAGTGGGRREGGGQRARDWDGNRPAPSALLGEQGKPYGGRKGGGRSQGGQPDPMRTSVGYIGGDSLSRARQGAKRNGAGNRRRSGGR